MKIPALALDVSNNNLSPTINVMPSIVGIAAAGFAVIILPGPGPPDAVPERPVDPNAASFF